MKFITIAWAVSVFSVHALAAPTDINTPQGGWVPVKCPDDAVKDLPYYPPPPGGWESVKYPDDAGKDLPYYPPPPGGWGSVKYPPGAGSNSDGGNTCDSLFSFTSTFHVTGIGSEVHDGTNPAPGPKDAIGLFNFGINSFMDIICYNITLLNVAGDYQSPARTATHIHQAARGASGPPRLVFPNPIGNDKYRISIGCIAGPFTTGVIIDGKDTGMGFVVKQIEEKPSDFFADSHTTLFPKGVVRGQISRGL